MMLKKDIPRVYALIGRLKDEQTGRIQALRFPKTEPDNWTLAKAKDWVTKHFKKSMEDFMDLATKGAIGVHHTATTDEGWDEGANRKRLGDDPGAAKLRSCTAWVDPDADPANKISYKFLHHMISADGTLGAANLKTCSSTIGVLNGGRGGTDIPAGDYAGVYRHVAAHLRDAKMEPPPLKEVSSGIETKDFKFEVKQVDEAGTFEGVASVYGITDLGGDMVERGAFSKSIAENPQVPVFWRHADPIGKGSLTDDGYGLQIKGKLTLGVTQAREALELMRDGVVKGLSIGFTTLKDAFEGKVRVLKELKLWEVSVVPFPMLPAAQVTRVKEFDGADPLASEISELFSEAGEEMKAGRTLSQATRDRIQRVINDLQALLQDADGAAAGKADEPEELHSTLNATIAVVTLGTSNVPDMQEILSGTQRAD